jgi:hypothetical protein
MRFDLILEKIENGHYVECVVPSVHEGTVNNPAALEAVLFTELRNGWKLGHIRESEKQTFGNGVK